MTDPAWLPRVGVYVRRIDEVRAELAVTPTSAVWRRLTLRSQLRRLQRAMVNEIVKSGDRG